METRQLSLEDGVAEAVRKALADAYVNHLSAVRVGKMNYVLHWEGEKLRRIQSRVILPERTAGQG